MSKVYVVTSGKGGVGKTTATANLGAGLAGLGKRVALVDADIGLRNLDLMLGLENRIVFDLVDVLDKKCRSYKQALIRDKRFESLFLLPAAQSKNKDAVKSDQMKELMDQLREEFDYVFIDCPAGIEGGFHNAVIGADEAIIITNPEVSSVRDADRVIGLLEAEDKNKVSLIVNRIRNDLVKKGQMLSIDDIQDILRIDLLGVVPEDQKILFHANKGEPVILDRFSPAGDAYRKIVGRLNDPTMPREEITQHRNGGLRGFLIRLMRSTMEKLEKGATS
ncbi:MAG: septum site-determining protein MinD [Candidatus Eremiobacteraeota bacterium]|nr:septum site-determining protein MinD [Candidatus Eremiobacteraeota bacterium]